VGWQNYSPIYIIFKGVRELPLVGCTLWQALALLIFATFSIAQTSLALHSLNAKIEFEGWLAGLANPEASSGLVVCNVGGVSFFFCGGKKKT
jgi:hypothetical protein